MYRYKIILMLVLLCALTYTCEAQSAQEIFREGERLTYDVKYKKLRIGESVLTFHGERDLNGKKVYYVTFVTRVPSFKDAEDLYADMDTFLPVEVHRSIKKSTGFNDNIVERYDQDDFRVDIKQKSRLRTREFSIQKQAPINNAILLAYYYRMREDFNKDRPLEVTLPQIDFKIMYGGTETLDTPMGQYKAHVFTSDPPKFRLWLSADEKRIPLKIQNPGMLGHSLIIKEIDNM
jgi:hypothetical protein